MTSVLRSASTSVIPSSRQEWLARAGAAAKAPDVITERSRGELMVLIAAAKAARATARTAGLDRFWRDLRTHTLHDPVAYTLREIGEFTLNDRIPEPRWYS